MFGAMAKRPMIPFEDDNLKAYRLLLRIEVALRESLRIHMESQFGPSWRKKIPGEYLNKIKESQREEARPNFDYVRLGPLYYLTYGDLLSVIKQKVGEGLRENLGGELVMKQLETLCGPRNALSHARGVSSTGLRIVESVHLQLENAFTSERLAEMLQQPDVGVPRNEAIRLLLQDLGEVSPLLCQFPDELPIPSIYETAELQYWWTNDELAGFDRSLISNTVESFRKYNSIPRALGSVNTRRLFLIQAKMRDAISNCTSTLEHAIREN